MAHNSSKGTAFAVRAVAPVLAAATLSAAAVASLSATLTGSTNILSVMTTNAAQFFRLRQPNF